MLKTIFKILILSCFFPAILSAQANVKNVVGAYFAAIGGSDLINQVETFYSISDTEINGNQLTIYNKQKKPNQKSIVIHKNNRFLSKKIFKNDTGYEIIGSQRKDYSKAEVLNKIDRIFIFPEHYYLEKAVFLGKKEVMGRICNVLGVEEKRIYYDVLTGLKLKASNVKMIRGQRILNETYYVDYKEVKGIKFPVVLKSIIKDREIIYYVRSISLNRDVSISDFE